MIGDSLGLKPTLSSLPLQILIHIHWHYIWIFFILNICLFTYKGNFSFSLFLFIFNFIFIFIAVKYYYPGSILAWDYVTIFCYVIVETSRLFLGILNYLFKLYFIFYILASKGNKTTEIGPLAGSLFLLVPIVVLHAYYMTLQLYVLVLFYFYVSCFIYFFVL